ncbi:MAG: BlaI/MecI/CopY family transcriptional regulator [Acidobacteriaceae bacterium]|nr:BlaI/MecI/CopY family transcriptional regulator [Acidobacteriaceae bacterium]
MNISALFKRRSFKPGSGALGPLELQVMEILWSQGECNVRDVARALARPLAYTTLMTTLDRLFKKDILNRRKVERAFVYAPLLTRHEWNRRLADEWVAGFLTRPDSSRDLLVSCLIDAVETHDASLLRELERKIASKRRELAAREKP